MKRVIILSQARSGSTLAQRVLNTVPNSYIAGENKNFWYHIFKAYKSWEYIPTWETKLAESKGEKPFSYDTKTDAYKPCWFNENWDGNFYEMTESFRRMFDVMHWSVKINGMANNRIQGFKEIRFPLEQKEFNEYLDWWRMLFPDIYFIFTVRDINEVVKSGWHKETDRKELKQREKLLRSRKDAFLLEYGKQDWKGLFNYLDLDYNEKEVQRILNKKL